MRHKFLFVLKITIVILSASLWILIPFIKMSAQLFIGRDAAGSLALSLMTFHRMSVFYANNVPPGLLNRVLYAINDASELIAFLGSVVLISAIRRKRSPVITASACIVLTSIVTAVYIRGGLFSATFPTLAVASGLIVAALFRSVPLSTGAKQTV